MMPKSGRRQVMQLFLAIRRLRNSTRKGETGPKSFFLPPFFDLPNFRANDIQEENIMKFFYSFKLGIFQNLMFLLRNAEFFSGSARPSPTRPPSCTLPWPPSTSSLPARQSSSCFSPSASHQIMRGSHYSRSTFLNFNKKM